MTTVISNSVVAFAEPEGLDYQSTFQRLRLEVPFARAMISTTLPRGGLQVIQAPEADPTWTRTYSREHHLLDAVAWEGLLRRQPVRLSDLCSGNRGEASRATVSAFESAALAPAHLGHYAAAPLAAPLLDGYPGALQLFRQRGDRDFDVEELDRLAEAAQVLDEAGREARCMRRNGDQPCPLSHEPPCRQVAVAAGGRLLFPAESSLAIDADVRQNLLEALTMQLAGIADRLPQRKAPGEKSTRTTRRQCILPATTSAVLQVPDRRGEQWVFRLVLYEFFPALSGHEREPVAVASLPPECDAWAQLRSIDIQADSDLARLVPALQYMHRNFTAGINLPEVASSVNLSPFHFHRRFTELLGTTPKQFLFDCQIASAKRDLAQGEKRLSDIAASAGFAHQSHFTSRFRQATGMTPTMWKRLASQAGDASQADSVRRASGH